MHPKPIRIYSRGLFWIALYLLAVIAPVLLTFLGVLPDARGFLLEFGVLLGFVAMTIMGMQFLLTARFRRIAVPYGVDTILQFHRQIGIVVLLFVLGHPLILFLSNPEYLEYLDPRVNFLRTVFLVAAVIATVLLVILPLWRVRFGLSYEWWRVTHGLLAALVLLVGLAHMLQVGHYVAGFWRQILWILLTALFLGLLVSVRIVKPWRMRRRPWRVAEVRPERSESVSVAVEPDGHEGFSFRAGQYAWITLGETPFSLQQHPFSFSSSARRPERIEFTVKELGDFTSSLTGAEPGTRAYLEGPYGRFCLDPKSEGGVFLMGGIGITPAMSMLRTLRDENDPRPHLLIYGNKNWEEVVFREEIEELPDALNLRIVHVLEEAPEGWEGETGFVDADLLKRRLSEFRSATGSEGRAGGEGRDFEYFICGPEPMMDLVEEALLEQGVPLWKIHSERFKIV